MLDLKLLRQQPDLIRDLCQRRGAPVDVDRLFSLDESVRQFQAETDELRHRRKKLSGPEAREQGRAIKERLQALERRLREAKEEREALWVRVPNLLSDETPMGHSDEENVEIRRWGTPLELGFKPRTHEELGELLDILDLKRGSRVSGHGFFYWKGDGARLARGMFQLALDLLAKESFVEMFTPVLTREFSLFGTGYLPFFEDQVYRIQGEDLCLIGTSEQTLVGYHGDEILKAEQLPLRYCSYSPCFRTEAGAHGRASRGAFRVHQFHKVEQIVFCRPEESEEWHLRCLQNEEAIMQALELPYRLVNVCVGDLGHPGYKKYDIEAWFAGFGAYRETHSNTNLLDYQSRRTRIRYRDGKRMVFPHTISATMITDRALYAVLENNQLEDGRVHVPEILRPFIDGREFLQPHP